ncbi:MAG: hypothetical protein ACYCXY_12165 [Acidimicrobiales bacterium]
MDATHTTCRSRSLSTRGIGVSSVMLLGIVLGTGLTAALAATSPVLAITQAVPQVVRVARSGAEGVSMSTWMLLVVLSELWGVYGVFASVPAEIATNIPTGLLALAIVVLVARRRAQIRETLTTAVLLSTAVAALSAACAVLHRESVEAGLAVAGSLAIYLPQFANVLRKHDLGGVAPATWVLACLSAVSWGTYGLLIHKVPVYLPSVVMLPVALVIVIRTIRARATPSSSVVAPCDVGRR